ncbi:zinc metallopeptidase [Amphibacillus indicireducens]|uniref:Zinc metallopeptidase n=1 Tax=Amphibacillus indicireducens TaxID=1076330 RepID=A0ABP7VE80_9BACI
MFYPIMGIDAMYLLIMVAFGIAMWAQANVQNNFERFSRVQSGAQITGLQVARRILDNNGLYDVKIERSGRGTLSDHYDPRTKTVRLSDPIYSGSSIASLAVAAHEVGHAIQHDQGYLMLRFRTALVPVANLGSRMAPIFLIAGFIFSGFESLIGIGIGLFAAAVLFQLVTLPVEFNASTRAKNELVSMGMIMRNEEAGISKVLNAAALTYVASTLIAVLQLFRLIMIFGGRRR